MNSATNTVGWAAEPRGRGTIGLIWSCVITIFLCTWSAVHPNLPAVSETWVEIFLRRLGMLLITLVAPEFTTMAAVDELTDAWILRRKTPGWSFTQCFFVTMGGFAVESASDDLKTTVRIEPTELVKCFETGQLPWPDIVDSDIEDRSKADWVVKSITLVQVLWFVTQVVGRAAQGLSITTLELFTLGSVAGAAIMYVAWWNKPFDVRTPVVLQNAYSLPPQVRTIRRVEFIDSGSIGQTRNGIYGLILVSLAFGGMHILGWQFHFPTPIEKLLWRISSIGATVLPLSILLAALIRDKGPRHIRDQVRDWSAFLLLLLYVLLRLYMFIEMFAGLRSVPVDVYKTPQWSQYLPSFG